MPSSGCAGPGSIHPKRGFSSQQTEAQSCACAASLKAAGTNIQHPLTTKQKTHTRPQPTSRAASTHTLPNTTLLQDCQRVHPHHTHADGADTHICPRRGCNIGHVTYCRQGVVLRPPGNLLYSSNPAAALALHAIRMRPCVYPPPTTDPTQDPCQPTPKTPLVRSHLLSSAAPNQPQPQQQPNPQPNCLKPDSITHNPPQLTRQRTLLQERPHTRDANAGSLQSNMQSIKTPNQSIKKTANSGTAPWAVPPLPCLRSCCLVAERHTMLPAGRPSYTWGRVCTTYTLPSGSTTPSMSCALPMAASMAAPTLQMSLMTLRLNSGSHVMGSSL